VKTIPDRVSIYGENPNGQDETEDQQHKQSRLENVDDNDFEVSFKEETHPQVVENKQIMQEFEERDKENCCDSQRVVSVVADDKTKHITKRDKREALAENSPSRQDIFAALNAPPQL